MQCIQWSSEQLVLICARSASFQGPTAVERRGLGGRLEGQPRLLTTYRYLTMCLPIEKGWDEHADGSQSDLLYSLDLPSHRQCRQHEPVDDQDGPEL